MVIVDSISAMREHLAPRRRTGPVGLVPTMGALHAGHARLIAVAQDDCETVVVSIFVNPLQFDREEDLRRYPRTLDADAALCASLGVDFIFAPTPLEMYPEPPRLIVDVLQMGDYLCGRFRHGHFRGVATVVMKLFQIVEADRSYFGEKDAQQLAIIRRLVRDLNVNTTIVGVPTVREADGVALSSRNRLLSADERLLAPVLYAALTEASRQIAAGVTGVDDIKQTALLRVPADPRIRMEYLELVDPETMQPVQAVSGPTCVAGAMWVGSTRLIDNVLSIPQTSVRA